TDRSTGFSQKMCFFAAAARVIRSLCVSVGEPIATTSIDGSAKTASGVDTVAPSCAASCAALSPTGSQTYFRLTPGKAAMLLPWMRPMRPAPNSATFFMGSPVKVLFGLGAGHPLVVVDQRAGHHAGLGAEHVADQAGQFVGLDQLAHRPAGL